MARTPRESNVFVITNTLRPRAFAFCPISFSNTNAEAKGAAAGVLEVSVQGRRQGITKRSIAANPRIVQSHICKASLFVRPSKKKKKKEEERRRKKKKEKEEEEGKRKRKTKKKKKKKKEKETEKEEKAFESLDV